MLVEKQILEDNEVDKTSKLNNQFLDARTHAVTNNNIGENS